MAKPGPQKGQAVRKGVPNKRSVEIEDRLKALGCDPIEGMARIALDCETAFAKRLRELVQGEDVDIPGLYKDLSLAGQMYKELAQYVAPKRKAIEHTGANGGAIQQSISRIELVPLGNDPSDKITE